jgi:glyoxylase-like metal-dependent hydrolase (beta-lactamase superfamily II)
LIDAELAPLTRQQEARMASLTRRTLLAGSASAAAATTFPLHSAAAAAPPAGKQAPGFYRFKIGSYELTAVYDGLWYRDIDDKFVRNVPFPEVQQALTDARMPANKIVLPFTALLVNTGAKLILIDTGTGGQIAPTAGSMDLGAAGIDPKAVDAILISHFHPDHINGIKTKENQVVFPNAEINVPAPEWDYWMDDANMNAAPAAARPAFRNVRRVFGDIAKEVKRFEPGKEVAPGITSIAAYGHTPGHTVFAVASGNASLLVLGDTTNHPALFARHPEWQAVFDVDGSMAAETRKKLLDRTAADRMLVQGYHFPFPASGHIAKEGSGYEFVPVHWQPTL